MTTNRISIYLDPVPIPQHHHEPTEVTLADDVRKIARCALVWFGVGLIIGAFLAGLMMPVVCAVRLIEGK